MIGRALPFLALLVATSPVAADPQLFGDYVRISIQKPPKGGVVACAKLAKSKRTTRISETEIADSTDVFFSGPVAYSASRNGIIKATVKTRYNVADTPLVIERRAPGFALISITSDMVPMHDADEYGRRASFYCRIGAGR